MTHVPTKEEIEDLLWSGAIDGKEFTRMMDELSCGLNKLGPGAKERRLRSIRKSRFMADRDKILKGNGRNTIQLDSRNDLVELNTGGYACLICDAAEVESIEVLVDEERALHTDSAGLLGRAALGGLLTGGVGAIVLALGAKKKEVRSVKTVRLKLTLSDAEGKRPDFVIQLYPCGWTSAEEAVRMAEEWHGMLSNLVLKAVGSAKHPSSPVPGGMSLADELAKLGQLRQAGILSEEEFRTAKAALL